jgi:hypothetical protein
MAERTASLAGRRLPARGTRVAPLSRNDAGKEGEERVDPASSDESKGDRG